MLYISFILLNWCQVRPYSRAWHTVVILKRGHPHQRSPLLSAFRCGIGNFKILNNAHTKGQRTLVMWPYLLCMGGYHCVVWPASSHMSSSDWPDQDGWSRGSKSDWFASMRRCNWLATGQNSFCHTWRYNSHRSPSVLSSAVSSSVVNKTQSFTQICYK